MTVPRNDILSAIRLSRSLKGGALSQYNLLSRLIGASLQMADKKTSPLRPHEIIQRIMLSSPCRFVGEYENDTILVSHAWSGFEDRGHYARLQEGPSSRNAFVVSFRTEPPIKRTGQPLPEFTGVAETLASYFSVLFGKRFDSHGVFESNGGFGLPDLSGLNEFIRHTAPHNRHIVRSDYSIPLNLAECRRLQAVMFDGSIGKKARNSFIASCKFYMLALKNSETDFEIAYLNLITAIEIISHAVKFSDTEFLDDEAQEIISRIRAEVKDADDIALFIQNKIGKVKKRFLTTVLKFIDKDFFTRREAKDKHFAFQAEKFAANLSAAYDLRSLYVHTGISFGHWVRGISTLSNHEIQVGTPITENKSLSKMVALAPTFAGLERVTRCVILRFAQDDGLIDLSGIPDPPSENPVTT